MKYFYIVILLIFFFLLLATINDIYSISNNEEIYRKIYSIGNSSHFQFQSSTNFVIWRVGQMIIYGYLVIESYRRFKGLYFGMWSKVVYISILTLSFLWLIYFYSVWIISGYDHYPGFDPYFF